MDVERATSSGGPARQSREATPRWHVPLLLAVSVGFESLFFRHGLNRIDEGWPLYAAKLLHEGGTLYRDVFWVFPPGHLLGAWLGTWIDPPGVLFARGVYLAFDVAACLGVHALGRRVMPPGYALLGALLLAIGAPESHLKQLLFGYRYLAIAMLALLCFARRLDTGRLRWSFAAGVSIGIALGFRLTPGLATAAAIGIGAVVAERRPSRWLRDALACGLGVAAVALPLFGVLCAHAGPDALWRELIVRPVVMTDLQSLPIPPLALPGEWTRRAIRNAFVAVQFRAYGLLYAVYLGALAWRWLAALRRGRPFEHAFLVTLVVWGAIYFARTLGRSDEPHLDSALPPVCLLMGHAASRLRHVPWPRSRAAGSAVRTAVCAALLFGFAFLSGSDWIARPAQRGHRAFASTGGRIFAVNPFVAAALDRCVEGLRAGSRPGDVVLDLTASPLLYVLADRDGPGFADVVMPGTFLDEAEERAFLARLRARPPALVVWPTLAFDHRAERHVSRMAPLVAAWVRKHYRERLRRGRYSLWAPREDPVFD